MPGDEVVVVVEDDDALRCLLERVLRERGYSVVAANDGEQAIRAVAGGRADLLVTDVVMPRLGGPALAEALRRERPWLPVLYISGWYEKLSEGADGALLMKPFSIEAFELAVRTALAGRQLVST